MIVVSQELLGTLSDLSVALSSDQIQSQWQRDSDMSWSEDTKALANLRACNTFMESLSS